MSRLVVAGIYLALDGLGFIPGAGVFFDSLNALLYTVEGIEAYIAGDAQAGRGAFVNAGISVAAAVPIKGYLAAGTQVGRQGRALGKLAAPVVVPALRNPLVRQGLVGGAVLTGSGLLLPTIAQANPAAFAAQIAKAGYKSQDAFAASVFSRYQRFVDDAYEQVTRRGGFNSEAQHRVS